ncbi:MAG: hypothetical protein KC518_02260 [Candidatus Cloacimonetes bacterium]|nr:hypothetical protein [Candidatus Cloacimonadota bacterium]
MIFNELTAAPAAMAHTPADTPHISPAKNALSDRNPPRIRRKVWATDGCAAFLGSSPYRYVVSQCDRQAVSFRRNCRAKTEKCDGAPCTEVVSEVNQNHSTDGETMSPAVKCILFALTFGLFVAAPISAKDSTSNQLAKTSKVQTGAIVAMDLSQSISIISKIKNWSMPVLVEYNQKQGRLQVDIHDTQNSYWNSRNIDGAKSAIDKFREDVLQEALSRTHKHFNVQVKEADVVIYFHYSDNQVLKFVSGVYQIEGNPKE